MPDQLRRVAVTPPMLTAYDTVFDSLRELGLEVIINGGPYPMHSTELAAFIGTAEAVIVGLDVLSADVFDACPSLRIVARNGVGLDNVDLRAADAHGVAITAPYGANSTSVAELTFGLLLSLARRIVSTHQQLEEGVWQRTPGTELAGKTLGIVGLGRIGKRVALRALAFEMNVIANDIAPDEAFAAQHNIPFVSLENLLQTADVVSLHVPLTPDTLHLMDAHRLQLMKPTAMLINTARGKVINAPDLIAALDRCALAGAALDVHTVEGQVERELLCRANVVTTTHLVAYTHESLYRTTASAVASLVDYFNNRTPGNLVTPHN